MSKKSGRLARVVASATPRPPLQVGEKPRGRKTRRDDRQADIKLSWSEEPYDEVDDYGLFG